MPYARRLNNAHSIARSDAAQITMELNLLRAELDDMRAKYTALRDLLVAATALGAGYGTGTALNASTFTAT